MPAMGINRRRLDREQARARAEAERLRQGREEAATADAVWMIEAWNARLAGGQPLLFSPTIRAALGAGYRWMTVACPGCRTCRDVDLAATDRHPDASIASLIPALSCRNCRPHAPLAQIRRLRSEKQGKEP
jgi:hypothetical protein